MELKFLESQYATTAPHDVIKLTIIAYRNKYFEAFERFMQAYMKGGENPGMWKDELDEMIVHLETFFLQILSPIEQRSEKKNALCNTLMRYWDTLSKNPKNVDYAWVVRLNQLLERFLYKELQLTKIDTRELYDRTRVELDNRFEHGG